MKMNGQLYSPSASPPGIEALVPIWHEVVCDSVLVQRENREISLHFRKSNADSSAGQTVAQYYTDWTMPSVSLSFALLPLRLKDCLLLFRIHLKLQTVLLKFPQTIRCVTCVRVPEDGEGAVLVFNQTLTRQIATRRFQPRNLQIVH
jgi:hypothetical protein